VKVERDRDRLRVRFCRRPRVWFLALASRRNGWFALRFTDPSWPRSPRATNRAHVEKKWYAAWLSTQAFAGKVVAGKEPYTIVIPPPNVTGVLTMGHVLNNTIQDILIRRARLEGKSALWIPGVDHAGIATQTVVERELRKQKKTRHDFGREKFLEKVWEWRHEKGGIILEQLRRLGASCDWERTQFTMDERYSKAVLTVFVDLFNKRNIYRGKRMVNWCPASLTALSDEEVIMKPVNGTMYRVRYELVDAPGQFVEVKTTRPETIPGDVADRGPPERPALCGLRRQKSEASDRSGGGNSDHRRRGGRPGVRHRRAEDHAGSRQGGFRNRSATQAAHRRRAERRRHAQRTRRSRAGGPRSLVARKKSAELLKAVGALVAEEPYTNNVGYSERADVPIEPRPHVAMVAALSADRRSQGGGARWPHQILSGTLEQSLPPLAREHPGLVHQPPALVGTSHPGVVSEGAGPRETHRNGTARPGEDPRLA